MPVYTTDVDLTTIQFQNCITSTQNNYPNVEIIGNPTNSYNCHSYAWYSADQNNPYCIFDISNYIEDAHTDKLSNDEEKMAGDIVVYKDANNKIEHSAIIKEIKADGTVICTSKWGANVLCNHELSDVLSDYLANGLPNCDYYRITPHLWESITTNSNGTHELTCSICGVTTEENCDLSYACVLETYHKATCVDCNYSTSNIPCEDTYTYVSNGDGSHTATCSVCEGSITRQCNKECIWYSGSQHRAECADCGVVSYESCSSGVVYTGNGTTHTHALGCDECGHATGTATACTFSSHYAYAVNGVNYHRNVCDGCGYAQTTLVQCVYKNSDNCFLCGASKDSGRTASIQESSPAE